MAQKNRDYWEERQIKREAKAFTTIQDIEKEYKIALEKAKQDINKEISRITTTYMNDNVLNYIEALKHLKGDDYKVWKKDLHDYMKEYNKLLKNAPLQAQKLYLEIETLSAKSRISRLDSLKSQIDMELTKLIFRVENDSINALTSVYRDTFIEVTKDLGINPVVSRDKIKTVLDKPWSGANFSQRLWSNTDKLAETVKQEIVNGMIQGINLKTMTKRVSERFETAKKNDVERLLRTEVNYTLNQATLDGYKEAGIEKYEFSATLDNRTSQICSELHGNIFEIKNIAVGLNYPPMHPRCRSTTIPIIDYESLAKTEIEIQKNNDTIKENEAIEATEDKQILSYGGTIRRAKELTKEFENNDVPWTTIAIREHIDEALKNNALPKVVSPEEFEKLSKSHKVLYRGVADTENITAKQLNQEFKYGALKYGDGRTIYGRGIYSTFTKETAEFYAYDAYGDGGGELLEMILSPNAKIVSYKDIIEEWANSGVNTKKVENMTIFDDFIGDVGNFAALKGYDAIDVDSFQKGHDYVVILNRGALIVKK